MFIFWKMFIQLTLLALNYPQHAFHFSFVSAPQSLKRGFLYMPHSSPILSPHNMEAESKQPRADLAMKTLHSLQKHCYLRQSIKIHVASKFSPCFHTPSFLLSLLSLLETCVTKVTRVKITNKNIPPTESVQESLERRFGRVGGRIPITPSQSFQERISVRSFVDAVRLAVMLGASFHYNFSTFWWHSLPSFLTVSRINIKEIKFGSVRKV